MFEKITDSVYIIYGRRSDSNSILLLDSKALVDTGTGMLFPELAADLGHIGIMPTGIESIINTHCHYDHIGGNHHFSCKVYAHAIDLPHIRSADPRLTASDMFSEQLLPQERAQEIPSEFNGWKILHTPGHTGGSICLYNGEILISGDTLFASGHGRTDLPGGDQAKMEHSLNMLQGLDYTILLPGHGPALRR